MGTVDERHEVDFMIDRLVVDTINDTTITVPGSILVYSVEQPGKKMCEFDGIIIHPMRPKNQVVFLEAKNTKAAPTYGKKCLQQKLKTLRIPFNDRDIAVINHDAFMNMTI